VNLTQIIAVSSVVSAATFILLMIQKRKPTEFRYPAWYLGSKGSFQYKIPKFTLPPLLAVLALIAFTLGAGLLFRPELLMPPSTSQNREHLVWIDPTFSAHLSRIQNDFSAQAITNSIVEKSGQNQWLGLELQFDKNLHWGWKSLKNQTELFEFIKEQSQFVLPHASPFDALDWENLKTELTALTKQERALHIISDGQTDTVRGLLPLSTSIAEAHFYDTGEIKKFAGTKQEIIPEETLAAWQKSETKNTPWAILAADSLVPSQARPGLAIESFENSVPFVSGLNTTAFPLVTLCGNSLGGLQELDPTSDLRSLLEFLKVPTRLQLCLDPSITKSEQSDANSLKMARAPELWRNRNQSLWVVPLSEEVVGSLFLKSEFWYPQGFDPCCDFVVYTAPLGILKDAVAKRMPIQLDAGAAPVPLELAAEPPQGSLKIPESNDGSDGFIPYFESADSVKLAYKAIRARAFYLRTSLGTPAGELGRSGTWSQIWMGFLKASSMLASPSLKRLAPFDLKEWNGAIGNLLNPSTLDFENNSGPTKNPSFRFFMGLQQKPALLIEVHPNERTRTLMSASEIEALFKPATSSTKTTENVRNSEGWKSPMVQLGMGLVALALIFFWFGKFSKPDSVSKTLLLFFVLLSTKTRVAEAQGFEMPFLSRKKSSTQLTEVPNIPFRIGWCASEIPVKVSAQYAHLREVLANRGTIELPTALKPNGCSAGASEIWWATTENNFSVEESVRHIQYGGMIVLEGVDKVPSNLAELANPQSGLTWQKQQRRGPLYRSFYLLQSFDHCLSENTWMLNLRKKPNANSPVVVATQAHFLEDKSDCMGGNVDKKERSFVNLMYALLTTDYKEDQMQLPEILGRIRSLGLEP
jgi:hypothetical protein